MPVGENGTCKSVGGLSENEACTTHTKHFQLCLSYEYLCEQAEIGWVSHHKYTVLLDGELQKLVWTVSGIRTWGIRMACFIGFSLPALLLSHLNKRQSSK